MTRVNKKTFKDFKSKWISREKTLTSEVEGFISTIQSLSHINAFNRVYADEALNKAKELDAKLENNEKLGKLAGMVISIKDNICYQDHGVTASSKILHNFVSLYSATAVERLLKEDAIIIGHTNNDEFAMGSSNETSFYGKVLNPLDTERVPGGSSGGAAASVAAEMCHVALGSDTGGSIRQPAAFCGILGFKPSYGRVSRYGLLAYGSSFDQIGPLAHNIEDLALIMEVIAGKDEYDATAIQENAIQYTDLESNQSPKKIAVYKEILEHPSLNPETKKVFNEYIEKLKKQGHQVNVVSFPYIDYLVPAYYVLTTAEASSNLSRYDGIHYGYRSPNATNLESTYRLSRGEGFGKEVQRRILLGTFVLSAGYYDAYYNKAQKVRRILKDATDKILTENDFILCPTTPNLAFKFGEHTNDPIQMYLEDIFTVQANLTGHPALAIPVGDTSEKLRYSMQFLGKIEEEEKLLGFANNILQ
jgi:aspartyl-tRNA(Asn)/glutamyl-tRNA(Gln) amidotransferase subunit A